MKFEGTLEIDAPRDRVWEFLTDPTQVSACAPDLHSVEVLDPTHFKLVSRAGVGAIRATFAFDVRFATLEPKTRADVVARGQAPGSAVEMRSGMSLADAGPGRTTMRWTSNVIVSGLIASVGIRLLQGAADKVTQQVFACIQQKLQASGQEKV